MILTTLTPVKYPIHTGNRQVFVGYGNPTALAKLSPGETVLDLGSGGSGGSTIGSPEVIRGKLVKIEPVTPRITGNPETEADQNHG